MSEIKLPLSHLSISTSGCLLFRFRPPFVDRSNLAKVQTLRFLKLRLFPLVGFSIPVQTKILFNSDGKEDKLYVTKYEDDWIVEKLLSASPSQIKGV